MMSYNSEVLGRITVAQRKPGEETATWTVTSDTALGDRFRQLQNIGHSIGGVTIEKSRKSGDYLITVPLSDPEHEAKVVLKPLIERFIRVIDRGAKQKREIPLAVNSDVPVFGHHNQG